MTDGYYNFTVRCWDLAYNYANNTVLNIRVDLVKPILEFVPPTDDNNTKVNRAYTYINISANEAIDWIRLEWERRE